MKTTVMMRKQANRPAFLVLFFVIAVLGDIATSRSWIPDSKRKNQVSVRLLERTIGNNLYKRDCFGRIIDGTHEDILLLRGGASKGKSRTATLSSKSRTATGKKKVGKKSDDKKEKESLVATGLQKYKGILPLTRIQITMVGLTTLLGMILGEEMSQGVLAMDPIRLIYGFQFWRPFTAATFLGPPSIGWLMNAYYLFEYGSTLERAYGTAQHLIFLVTVMTVLSVFSVLLRQPFFASPMITAMLHVLSRSMPNQKVKWLVFTVPYWSLPYGLMATDVLQAQSGMAALPHILGILAGHFYQFHKFVWPKIGGEDWLSAPDFLVQRLDPNAKRKDEAKDSVNSALKNRKRNRGTGRKLGSS